jgi:hypothetical protein
MLCGWNGNGLRRDSINLTIAQPVINRIDLDVSAAGAGRLLF